MFESLSLKPWEVQDYLPSEYRSWWKNTEIAKKIEKGNSSSIGEQTEALGSASASDHYHGGVVNYSAGLDGLTNADIIFTYTNFGENKNWVMNGHYRMDVHAQ